MHIQARSGIILFAKGSTLNIWLCYEYASASIPVK